MKLTSDCPVFFGAFSVLLILGACSGEKSADKSGEKKAATQVAAKVNKEEISVHQINGALAGAGNLPPEQAKLAGRDVLEKLIDQELLVRKAMDKKVDREPKVMQSLEASRRQILAQAYMEQLVAAVPKPTAEDVSAYFGKHPELFAERRVFRLQEISVGAGRDQLPELQKSMAAAKSLDDVLAMLKQKNIKFAGNLTTKAAEQLPMELVPKFNQMKNGQITVIPGDNSIMLIQLVDSRPAPIAQAAATPVIERFLVNQRRGDVASKEVKQLRSEAKIEYMGDFAKDKEVLAAEAKAAAEGREKARADADARAKAAADAKASATAEADAKARADIKARVEAQAKVDVERASSKGTGVNSASASTTSKESISKGLSGLR